MMPKYPQTNISTHLGTFHRYPVVDIAHECNNKIGFDEPQVQIACQANNAPDGIPVDSCTAIAGTLIGALIGCLLSLGLLTSPQPHTYPVSGAVETTLMMAIAGAAMGSIGWCIGESFTR